MDFGFNDEQEMLRSATRKFLDNELPISRVRELIESDDGFDREAYRSGAELGWTSLLVPERYGGAGQSIVDAVVVAEEHGRLVQPGPFLPTSVVAIALSELGTDDQKSEVLPGLVTGEQIATWCFAETEGTWDASHLALQLVDNHDGFLLSGTKMYVQDAHVADHLLVTARSTTGLTQVLVPATSAGLTIRSLTALDITRRLCEVRFDNVRLPRSAIVGSLGQADQAIERQLQAAIILTCAESVGAAQQLLDITVQYAKDRVQFNRPIGSFQAIKHKCANMLTWLEASRAATYYAALAFQDHVPDAPQAASIAKSYVSEAYSNLAGEALQIHGGIGFTWEHDVHLYLRRAKSNEVLYGDPAWHRERICTLLASGL